MVATEGTGGGADTSSPVEVGEALVSAECGRGVATTAGSEDGQTSSASEVGVEKASARHASAGGEVVTTATTGGGVVTGSSSGHGGGDAAEEGLKAAGPLSSVGREISLVEEILVAGARRRMMQRRKSRQHDLGAW